MIIRATFREGLDTQIDLVIIDNRIKKRSETILGILHENIKYQKLIFNTYPKISYNFQDKDFDKTLSLIQGFKKKKKDFFYYGNY